MTHLTRLDQLLREGVALLPGYLAPRQCLSLRTAYDAACERRNVEISSGDFPEHLMPMVRQRTVYLSDLQLDGAPPPEALAPPLKALAKAYLGKEPELVGNSFVRTMGPDRPNSYLHFHQDERLLGRPLLNLWIALEPAGAEAPGLEFALSVTTLLDTETQRGDVYPFATISQSEVHRACGGNYLRPQFRAGDAVAFLGVTPHRTYALPTMTASRASVELRFA